MSARLIRLTRRADFERLTRRGKKQVMPGLVLQSIEREDAPARSVCRLGFTVSKKVGGSVQRNRAKRRLRAAAALVLKDAQSGLDVVLVGRRATLTRPWSQLIADVQNAGVKLGVLAPQTLLVDR
ncbi:MAG: ribonuclease P protein component [Alphaproteobacteria bacterium]|nr:ribonuclease P protein component [Alphaproteobacteria bacterium]